jgi:hypothetical protein
MACNGTALLVFTLWLLKPGTVSLHHVQSGGQLPSESSCQPHVFVYVRIEEDNIALETV